MKVIVRDLSYDVNEKELRKLFGTVGEVVSVNLPVDHTTGRIEGTATIEMNSRAEAEDAVRHLHHKLLHGMPMRIHLEEEPLLAESAEPLLVEEGRRAVPHLEPKPHRPERSPGR